MQTISKQIASNLNINAINAKASILGKADKKAFGVVLDLSTMVMDAIDWWKSDGKAIAKSEGITLNMDEFAALYGWSKGHLYKLDRIGRLGETSAQNYLAQIEREEAEGKRPQVGIDSYLKWAKGGANEEGGDESEEGGEESEEVAQKPIITFTCRLADLGLSDKNLSLRINADGSVVTTASAEAIQQAISILTTALQQGSAE